jgi:hypothetical protein
MNFFVALGFGSLCARCGSCGNSISVITKFLRGLEGECWRDWRGLRRDGRGLGGVSLTSVIINFFTALGLGSVCTGECLRGLGGDSLTSVIMNFLLALEDCELSVIVSCFLIYIFNYSNIIVFFI